MFGLKLNEIAAWYAAGVATIVLLWDIYKWRRSATHLRLSVTPNMVDSATAGNASARRSIFVEVSNIGGKKTTITNLAGRHYASWWSFFRRKTATQFIVVRPDPGRIPHVLDVGERWTGLMDQTDDIEQMARNRLLYIVIYHSGARKPVAIRLHVPETPSRQSR